jgi:hypothetical protein
VSANDSDRWAARLAAEPDLFTPLATGSRLGVVAESVMAEHAPRATEMMVWQRDQSGMHVRVEPYEGFGTAAVDLLIALDDTAAGALASDPDGGWLRALRRLLRDGHVLFFARRPRADLEDAGYEELLHELGFAWLGACR